MSRERQGVPPEEPLTSVFPGEVVEVELFLTSEQVSRLEALASRNGATLAQFLRQLLQKGLVAAAEAEGAAGDESWPD
jgi:hypothetical protein